VKSEQVLCVYAAFRFLLDALCNPKMAVIARKSPYGVFCASSCNFLHVFRSLVLIVEKDAHCCLAHAMHTFIWFLSLVICRWHPNHPRDITCRHANIKDEAAGCGFISKILNRLLVIPPSYISHVIPRVFLSATTSVR